MFTQLEVASPSDLVLTAACQLDEPANVYYLVTLAPNLTAVPPAASAAAVVAGEPPPGAVRAASGSFGVATANFTASRQVRF